jgi:hypothetical protein
MINPIGEPVSTVNDWRITTQQRADLVAAAQRGELAPAVHGVVDRLRDAGIDADSPALFVSAKDAAETRTALAQMAPLNGAHEPPPIDDADLAAQAGRTTDTQPGPASGLPLIWTADVGAQDIDLPELIEDVYTAGGLSVIYGPSNSGKSYLTLHMDCAIARGAPALSKRTNAGLVVYIAGEGAASIKMRLAAYKQHHGLADFPLAIVPCAVNLLDPSADTRRVIDAIARAEDHYGLRCAKVTVDTLARAFGGGNENSSEDMGAVIRNADRIREASRTHLAFVHHSGKDESKGSRGHSSLRAATDTEIEVSDSGGGIHSLEVVKQRDLGSMSLRLSGRFVPLPFGADQWGKPRTVCVVEDAEAAPRKADIKARGRYQQLMLRTLAAGPMTRAELRKATADDMPKNRFYETLASLLNHQLIEDTVIGLRIPA